MDDRLYISTKRSKCPPLFGSFLPTGLSGMDPSALPSRCKKKTQAAFWIEPLFSVP